MKARGDLIRGLHKNASKEAVRDNHLGNQKLVANLLKIL